MSWSKLQKDESLESYASRFPHMGGVKIGDDLRQAAAAINPGEAIVEVGVWLGGGTAYLAQGAAKDTAIHCYDRFKVVSSEVKKAAAFGVQITEGQDTLNWVKNAVKPFGAKIIWHQGEIGLAMYQGPPIGVYVDDASKRLDLWQHAMLTFKPFFVPGALLFLMDYHFHDSMGSDFEAQSLYMQKHREFELVKDHLCETSCAVFRYIGDGNAEYKINVLDKSQRRTICEVLREIYRIAENRDESDVLRRVEEAYSMAKRMDRKLHDYKADWDNGFWKDQHASTEL